MKTRRVSIFISAALVAFAVGCGSGSTTPITAVSVAPSIAPTPTPIPTPTPPVCNPVPDPAKLAGYAMRVYIDNGVKKILDSTPFMADLAYCQATGYNWSKCPVKTEGEADRAACDMAASGRARDTGRYGPTWTFNDKPCAPVGTVGGDLGTCKNHQDNQFQLVIYGTGLASACNSANICSWIEVN